MTFRLLFTYYVFTRVLDKTNFLFTCHVRWPECSLIWLLRHAVIYGVLTACKVIIVKRVNNKIIWCSIFRRVFSISPECNVFGSVWSNKRRLPSYTCRLRLGLRAPGDSLILWVVIVRSFVLSKLSSPDSALVLFLFCYVVWYYGMFLMVWSLRPDGFCRFQTDVLWFCLTWDVSSGPHLSVDCFPSRKWAVISTSLGPIPSQKPWMSNSSFRLGIDLLLSFFSGMLKMTMLLYILLLSFSSLHS